MALNVLDKIYSHNSYAILYLLYRAIGLQALVGNVGGYIGLCLGYNFLQIPGLLMAIINQLKLYRTGKEKNPENNR